MKSSWWMSIAALIRCASSRSRRLTGAAFHWQKACLEKPSTRQVTATGMASARSRTSGNIILGGCRGRSRPWPGAGSRSPAPTAWCACVVRASPSRDHRHRCASDSRMPGQPRRPRSRRSSTSGPDTTPNSEAARYLSAGLIALTGHRDHVATELFRERLGHDADPSSEAAASHARSQLNSGQTRSPFWRWCSRPPEWSRARPCLATSSLRQLPGVRVRLWVPETMRSPWAS